MKYKDKKIAEKQWIKEIRQPDSRGMFQKLVKEDEAQYQKSLKANQQKVRRETISEQIERKVYQYDDTGNIKKPKHYDNPNIVDDENWKKPPKKFSNTDPSSYPSDRNQKQRMTSWDLIVESAKGKPNEMKEIRETLRNGYKSNPGSLSIKELKMIGKYKPKKQLSLNFSPIVSPVDIDPEPSTPNPVPQREAREIIEDLADERLKKEQEAYDKRYGKGGISKILRPE